MVAKPRIIRVCRNCACPSARIVGGTLRCTDCGGTAFRRTSAK